MIPSHNYARFLPACIESVLSQDLEPGSLEVIIIDDASSDDTPDVLRRYAHIREMRVVREERNRGYVAVYRRGMAAAEGRYLVPLDADDFIVERDALRTQLTLAERHARIGFVHSDTRDVDEAGRSLRVRSGWHEDGVVPSASAFRRLLMGNSVQHTGTLIRRQAYEEVGGYDAALTNSIDWDLWLRIARTWDVGHIARPLYAYRLHRDNMHRRVARSAETRDTVRGEVFFVLERATAETPGPVRARALAQAHLVMANALFGDVVLGEGWRHFVHATRRSGSVIGERLFWVALMRALMGSLLGREGVNALRAFIRSRR